MIVPKCLGCSPKVRKIIDSTHQSLVRRAIAITIPVSVVGMVLPTQNEGLVTIPCLKTGIHIPSRHIVIDFHGSIHLNAAQCIHHFPKALKADLRIMRNGNTSHLQHNSDSTGWSIDGISDVQLLHAIALNFCITAKRGHHNLFTPQIHMH